MKKTLAIITVICLFVSLLSINTYAVDETSTDSQELQVESTVTTYFGAQDSCFQTALLSTDSFAATYSVRSRSVPSIEDIEIASNEMKNLASARAAGLINYLSQEEINLLSWNVTVGDIQNLQTTPDGQMICDIYVWTEFEWFNDNFPDPVSSGFGTWHTLTLELIDGSYQIVDDKYNEYDISGINTADDSNVSVNCGVEDNDVPTAFAVATPIAASSTIAPVYSHTLAVQYANTYVGSGGENDYTYYNRMYKNYNVKGGDCANFASQCLYAGGFPETSTWYYNDADTPCTDTTHLANSDSSYDTHDCTKDDSCSEAWRRSSILYDALCANSHCIPDESPTASTFCYGDIGFFTSSGSPSHTFICTGRSGSQFLLTQHNTDRKNVLHGDSFIDSYGVYRVHIHCGTIAQQYNEYNHKVRCGGCGEYIYEAHYTTTPGTNAKCDGCGYRGIITVIPTSIANVHEMD